jgi:hypothetical protein
MNFHSSFEEQSKTSSGAGGARSNTGPARYNLPEDFAERASKGASNPELKRYYGVGDQTIARWRKEANTPATSGRAYSIARSKLPAPPDFKDFASRMTNRQLSERFKATEKTISRWRAETGCTASIKQWNSAQLPKQFVPPIAVGIASEACQFLRPHYRPVYDRGVVDGKQYKGQYVVGRQVLNEHELVELARSRGFKSGSEALRDLFSKYD